VRPLVGMDESEGVARFVKGRRPLSSDETRF